MDRTQSIDYYIGKIFVSPWYRRSLVKFVNNFMTDYDFSVNQSSSTWYYAPRLYEFSIIHTLCDRFEKVILKTHGTKNLQFDEMWANKNPPGSKTSLHNHKGSSNSAVFYLQKPKDSGNFILNEKLIKVNQNDLILFQSDLFHETEYNNSKHDRIVVGFNYTTY